MPFMVAGFSSSIREIRFIRSIRVTQSVDAGPRTKAAGLR